MGKYRKYEPQCYAHFEIHKPKKRAQRARTPFLLERELHGKAYGRGVGPRRSFSTLGCDDFELLFEFLCRNRCDFDIKQV